MYQRLDINPTAIKYKRNFIFLYLEIANSSTITSTVAIYRNVPAEIDINMPTVSGPDEDANHPLIIPIGFITNLVKLLNIIDEKYENLYNSLKYLSKNKNVMVLKLQACRIIMFLAVLLRTLASAKATPLNIIIKKYQSMELPM